MNTFASLVACAALAWAPMSPMLAQGILGSSNPRALACLPGGEAVFVGTLGPTEAAIIRTDGTSSGTIPVASFSSLGNVPGPRYLVATPSGKVFFEADDGEGQGTELWVSDMRGSGSRRVTDLRRGDDSARPSQFCAIGQDAVLFSADIDGKGREPCWTDGVTVIQLGDLQPGLNGSHPRGFTALGQFAIFGADNGSHGSELWITDGTPGGTQMLSDIQAGPAGSYPHGFVRVGSDVWFSANNGSSGFELWRTDGTQSGTNMIVDLRSGHASAQPTGITVALGSTFFTAFSGLGNESELWQTDGTIAGTVRVANPGPGSPRDPSHLAEASGRLWFVADDGVHGRELWSTTGATGTTAMVADVALGDQSSFPNQIVELDSNTVLFVANDELLGRELWRATASNAILVQDIAPGVANGKITSLTKVGTQLLFAAQSDDLSGQELYRTDGTLGGTMLVQDLEPAPGQLTLEVTHTGALFASEVNFLINTAQPFVLALGTSAGPGVDLNSLGIPSYGLLGLDPAGLWAFLVIARTSTSTPASVFEMTFSVPPSIQMAVQALTLNPIVFSGVTTLSNTNWDLSSCTACANAPSIQSRLVKYADDTFEYELDLAVAPSTTDMWLKVMRVHADGFAEEVDFMPIRAGRTMIRQQVELRRDEVIELRLSCGDPASGCFATKVLGC